MSSLAANATSNAATNGVVAARLIPQQLLNSTGAAFWELDLDAASKPGTVLTKFIQSQIVTAVRAALLKHPLASAPSAAPNTPEQQQQQIAASLYKNLITAVQSLKVVDAPESMEVDEEADQEEEDDEDDDVYPNRKRRKVMRKKQKRRILIDPYHVWFQLSSDDTPDPSLGDVIYWDENQDDLPVTLGGKLAILSAGGLLNSFSSCFLCTTPVIPIHPRLLLQQAAAAGTVQQWKNLQEQTPPLQPVTISHLHAMALALHAAIAEQVKADIVRTTPLRIQSLLASELTAAEFQSVRRRLHDTVILGKGVQSQQANNSNDDANDPAVAVGGSNSSQQHEIDKFKKCPGCGNNDQSEFVLDRKNGDVICSFCGIVVSESIMHEGSQFRKFEGEVDRNHHGDAANPLYSNAHNMGTSLSGVMPTTGAGLGGKGSGGRRNLETILKNAHAYTELNVSQFGRTDARRTRVGYKDRQKKSAFAQMTHAGDALNLHEAVVQRAKELFAGFRDDRELVQQLKGILAACLCEAFEQLSAEGKHILRHQQQMADQQEQQKLKAGSSNGAEPPVVLSGRAARRSELHHATMAGKGGLVLNTNVSAAATAATSPTATELAEDDGSKINGGEKPAASWDLEDCRSWLLKASRTIAQTWVEERKTNVQLTTTADNSKIPAGSVDELEGRLVEHAITLCEHLEQELQSRASSSVGASRVVTPRVNDMSKIGIKWQHAHERGSGGKGGVGGSGATAPTGGRTAGQILLLKTAKKLGVLLKDAVAGEAIHRELRAVMSRQEAWKQKEMREEATRQRFHQMQRKPWLAAKAQQ